MLRIEKRREKLDFPFATINIVLLLLFFFIVTGSLVGRNETAVMPPVAEGEAPGKLPRPLLVVDAEGRLFLDDRPVSLEKLPAAVAEGQMLNIVADRDYGAAPFLAILDRLRTAGIAVRVVALNAAAPGA